MGVISKYLDLGEFLKERKQAKAELERIERIQREIAERDAKLTPEREKQCLEK